MSNATRWYTYVNKRLYIKKYYTKYIVPNSGDKPYSRKTRDSLVDAGSDGPQTEYKLSSIPEIPKSVQSANRDPETLKEVLIRDIEKDLSDLDIEFVSKFIATSGTTISYSGTKKEQKSSFNKLIDSLIHQFPHLSMKLASVQLNYTLNYLIQAAEKEQ
ncbi:MAG: hypothetical protein ACW99A_19060 [Candidatus Kariarchaeaceae archaeon]|jgi:hypothetical protein